MVLDGREGTLFVNPGPEVVAVYHTLQREYVDLRDRLIANRDQESITADGVPVELLTNVNGPADAALAARVGASGVGLYRTEYLFLTHSSVPSEEEQLAAYRAVIEAAPTRHCDHSHAGHWGRQTRPLPRHLAAGQPVHGLA